MRRQNIKYVPFAKYLATSKEEKKPDRILDDVIKIIGAISGATVLFVALFYIFGSNYATGYFGAMNIPSQILSFTVWDYGNYAWFPMVFIVFLILFIFFIDPILDIILLKPSKRIQPYIKRNKGKESFTVIFNSIFKLTNIFLIILVLIIFILTIFLTQQYGTINGNSYLLKNANVIELHSSTPIALEDAFVFSPNTEVNEYYIYAGYHMLTKNNGKYYLFKDLDPETCKPAQVYIIDESSIDQVILSPAEDISDQCNK